MMKTKDIKKGISLIVLIITIIVVIILAAVVILTLSKNNPIESAKEARFKEDVRTFQDELSLYISKQYANAGGHWDESISATTYDKIVEYIPSFTKKYEGKFVINNNNLEYTNKIDEKEKEYSKSLNVEEEIVLPEEYQQLDYIESTGTQWIDTGLKGGLDTLGIDFKFNVNNTRDFYVLGNFNQVGQCGVMRDTTNNTDVIFRYYINNQFYGIMIGLINEEIVFSNKDSKIEANGDFKGTIPNNTSKLINSNLCIYGTGISQSFNASGKIYYLKIYDDLSQTNLIKNFIPCYTTTTVTNVDGEICEKGTAGLYDLVEGEFYTNKGDKTKGDFVCGPEV